MGEMKPIDIADQRCFQHYKNKKLYYILASEVQDANNKEPRVGTQVVYADLSGNVFIRDESEFFDTVEVDPKDPYSVHRFQPLSREEALERIVVKLSELLPTPAKEQLWES